MTDRDFKLLVREYLLLQEMRPSIDMEPKAHKRWLEVSKMLEQELETLSDQEQKELPFGDEEPKQEESQEEIFTLKDMEESFYAGRGSFECYEMVKDNYTFDEWIKNRGIAL